MALWGCLTLLLLVCGAKELENKSMEEVDIDPRTILQQSHEFLLSELLAGRHNKYLSFFKALPAPPVYPIDLIDADIVVIPVVDNGLFANVIHVLDGMVMMSSTAHPVPQWTRQDKFLDFKYVPVGQDLWPKLFAIPRNSEVQGNLAVFKSRINPLLKAPNRGLYFRKGSPWEAQRLAYHRQASKLKVVDEHAVELIEYWKQTLVPRPGGKVVGVHYRLLTEQVTYTVSDPLSDLQDIIRELYTILGPNDMIFLATDDEDALEALLLEFPDRIHYEGRAGRASTNDPKRYLDHWGNPRMVQVHISDEATYDDAVYAVVDVWTMAQCSVLLFNTDSNLVFTAAFLNPSLELVRVLPYTHDEL